MAERKAQSKSRAKKAAEEKEGEQFKKFGDWFKKQEAGVQTGVLYKKRVEQLEKGIEFIDMNILALQLEKKLLQGNTQLIDEMNDVLRKVGKKNVIYGMHFVEPYEVKKGIERLKNTRFESKDRFSEIQDKIEGLRDLKEDLKKRKTAVKSVLKFF